MSTGGAPHDPNIAKTIFGQLGGGRFLALTRACDLRYDSRSITVRLPKAKNSIAHVRIALTDADVYELTPFNSAGCELAPRVDDVFVENLQAAFEELTGLRCSL